MSSDMHTHQLSDGQLICDNEQCRKKVLERIEEMKIDFEQIVLKICQHTKIDRRQAWKILQLTSTALADRLIRLLNEEEIRDVIETFLRHKKTKQAFEKAFNHEKHQQTTDSITSEQLWHIYLNLCRNAIQILSKNKKERRTYMANYLAFDENQ